MWRTLAASPLIRETLLGSWSRLPDLVLRDPMAIGIFTDQSFRRKTSNGNRRRLAKTASSKIAPMPSTVANGTAAGETVQLCLMAIH